jgi:hypothetical protein
MAAAIYMAGTAIMIWVLQLFPAQPMLAPILRQVDSMVPPAFPILLVMPALAVDLIMHRLPAGALRLRQWSTAVGAGLTLMLVLGVVQWYFSEFLLTPGARNFVFGADQWDYNSTPGSWQHEFWNPTVTRAGAGWAAVVAMVSATGGLGWGNWMARVRR